MRKKGGKERLLKKLLMKLINGRVLLNLRIILKEKIMKWDCKKLKAPFYKKNCLKSQRKLFLKAKVKNKWNSNSKFLFEMRKISKSTTEKDLQNIFAFLNKAENNNEAFDDKLKVSEPF